MQKVLDFLERHVQWVAIAVAVLFMLYAFSAYLPVIGTPIAVDIAGEQLTPGEVDPKIRESADDLQGRIDSPTVVKITVPDYPKRYRDAISQPIPTIKLSPTVIASQRVKYPDNVRFDDVQRPDGTPQNNKVNDLPVLPPVIFDTQPSTDFAQVTLPPAAGEAAPAPAAPGAPAVAAANAVDTTWVRVPYTVPVGKIATAFQNANVPLNLMPTSFLRVELIRQKQLPGNKWGPEEVVQTLPTIAMPPMPGEGADQLPQQQQYSGWANAHQNDIVQPEFFAVLAGGDPRFSKPADAAVAPGTTGVFDPETFPAAGMPGSDMGALTPEQRAAVMAVRQRKAKEAEEQKKNRAPPPGGGEGGMGPGGGRRGGGGGGGGPRGFNTPAIPPMTPLTPLPPSGNQFQAQVGGNIQGRPPVQPGDPGIMMDPTMGIDGMPTAPQPGVPVQIPFTPVPNPGPWNPQSVQGGIVEGWAYDVTADADSTYRYRVRYSLRNPIFGVQNVANKPELIGVYALHAEDKESWTDPITIAPLTHVYLSALPTPGSQRVGFTVFRWQEGKRHRLTPFFAGPGDSIGEEKDGIDYRTHWTLVETRRDSSSNNTYALLMNADGVLKKIDFDGDKASPLFQQLNAEVDGPPVPTTPPGYPGGYPGGAPGAYPGGPPGGYPGAPGGP